MTPAPRPTARLDPAVTPEEVAQVRALFQEYAAALGVDLGFERFEEEVGSLPGPYRPPDGTLLLVRFGPEPVGCAGVRRFDPKECELKRLYLRPAARGRGLGRELLARALSFAEGAGYSAMRLDTLPSMREALALYVSFGFVDVAPYRHNPIPGTRYFRRELGAEPGRGTSK